MCQAVESFADFIVSAQYEIWKSCYIIKTTNLLEENVHDGDLC